jgi:thiol-disulfide isomerase/thioredoxin
LFAVFAYSVLDTMLLLWPHLPFWALATGVGFVFLKAVYGKRSFALGLVIVLLVSSIWYCGWYVPERLARKFNRFASTSAPAFTLQSVGDRSAVLSPRPGKILVIDFFSTSCVPCIAELPELSALHAELSQNRDIDFVLVASDRGRDTPERFRSFVEKRHVTIPLAFDPEGKVHASFGFKGIPALVVVDRTGRVRLTREGYNPADTGFRSNLVQLLKSL